MPIRHPKEWQAARGFSSGVRALRIIDDKREYLARS